METRTDSLTADAISNDDRSSLAARDKDVRVSSQNTELCARDNPPYWLTKKQRDLYDQVVV